MSDTSKDADVTNDVSASAGSVTAGGYDVLRFDPLGDLPAVGGAVPVVKGASHLLSGDGEWSELASIAGGVADLGFSVMGYMADPLNFLISAGLGFLIDVVQPLEDMLGLVTGNPERMGTEIAKWDRVGSALAPLADEIRSAADDGLVGWQGKAADAARQRLHEFADGVTSLTNDVGQLKMIMDLAKALMETAQGLVTGLMASFVEWLIFTWVPALAAAGPTFGASTAAAAAATTGEAATTTSRATSFIERVMQILQKLRAIVTRMHPRIMRRVQASFQLREGGRFARGWISSGTLAHNMFSAPMTYAPGLVKLGVSGVGDAVDNATTGQPGMSDRDQDRALDGDR